MVYQTTMGLSTMAIFSVFAGYFSETLQMRQLCYVTIRSPLSAFQRSKNAGH